jgi:two-component system, LuxR family, response regulator FixJ
MKFHAIVHIVDDDASTRDAVRLLASTVGLDARAYSSAQEFFMRYDGARPGCVILDQRMPGLTGVKALRQFAARKIRLPVIMISGYADVATAVRALKNGAVDFVEKPFDAHALLERIHASIDDDVANLKTERNARSLERRMNGLSSRESEVLKLVAAGLTSKEIARRLDISRRTVDAHRLSLMHKVGTSSVAALANLWAEYNRVARGHDVKRHRHD